MKRTEFILWLLGTLAVAALATYVLVGCSATKLAESVEVGTGHQWGTLDWSNSERSADTQSNSLWVSVHPFAGIADEPRQPVWESQPPVDVPDVTVNVPAVAQDESKPDDGVNVTLWVGLATALATGVAVWQRERVISVGKTIVGRKAKESE